MPVPTPLSIAPQLPFKYVGGDPSIDLVNTVDWTDRGVVDERLTDYERLTRWAEGAGVISVQEGAGLRGLAAAQPRMADRAYRAAIDLRWVLRRIYSARARGERIADDALAELNASLRSAMAQLEVGTASRRAGSAAALRWRWREADERLESLLWPVVRAAADLLTSDEADQLRECGGEDCGWLFVDRSRNGLRRWCQMETCGNREKSRRRRLG